MKIDVFRALHDYFEFFMALAVLSVVSLVNGITRLMAMLIAYGLSKL